MYQFFSYTMLQKVLVGGDIYVWHASINLYHQLTFVVSQSICISIYLYRYRPQSSGKCG